MKPHISENEAEIIANFAAEVISTLGLGRWRVLVMTDPSEKGTIATVTYVENRYVAELRVSKDWVSRKSEEKYEAMDPHLKAVWENVRVYDETKD